jgi:hypothetical protein
VISDWMLERYRTGGLSAQDKARVAQALTDDASVRARLSQLEADDAAILAQHPPARVAATIRERAAKAQPERGRLRWVPALAVAAALAVVAAVALQPGEDILVKGDGALRLYRLAAATPERLLDGAHVKPHDLVQVEVLLGNATHLVVVSVDGAGHTTRHWPAGDDTAAPPGFKQLPQSFELDDAPGFERFVLVTSREPLSVASVLEAAARAGRTGALELPKSAQQHSVLLDKAAP